MRSYALATMGVEEQPGRPRTSLETVLGHLASRTRRAGDGRAGQGPGGRDGEFDERQRLFLFSRSDTIYGGSNEIQRNVIAERVLGLPREAKG